MNADILTNLNIGELEALSKLGFMTVVADGKISEVVIDG